MLPLFEVERRHVLRVLHAVGGNESLAARILGTCCGHAAARHA